MKLLQRIFVAAVFSITISAPGQTGSAKSRKQTSSDLNFVESGVRVRSLGKAAETTSGWTGHFMAGLSWYNFSTLSNALPDYYPEIDNKTQCGGVDGILISRNYILGAQLSTAEGDITWKDSITLSAGVGEVKINVGYVIYSSEKWLFYPLAGFGLAGRAIEIENSNLPMKSWKGRDLSFITSSAFSLSFDLGAERGIRFIKMFGGMLIGLRAGATYGFQFTPWKYNEQPMGAPRKNLVGYYGVVTLGMGSWDKSATSRDHRKVHHKPRSKKGKSL
jgi:hypothetical protein